MACPMSARNAQNTDPSRHRPARGAALLMLCSLLLGVPCAQALELGPLSVHSTLGERLSAEVEIASVDGDDLDGIRASLADIATYERFGVPRPDVLSTVEVSLRTDENGTPVVRIGSSAPVHELFLNVLLRIEERDVQLIREVAILLDPLVTQAMPGRADGTALPAPSSDAAYTVRAGDSLMRIAERFAPPATSVGPKLRGMSATGDPIASDYRDGESGSAPARRRADERRRDDPPGEGEIDVDRRSAHSPGIVPGTARPKSP